MTQQTSTTRLSGWIHPGTSHFCGDDLDLRLSGTFAGEAAEIRVCLADARRHGFPAAADALVTRAFGNWLELSGTFLASPVDGEDCDPEHTGYLTGVSAKFSRRAHAGPIARLSRDVACKTITAVFSATVPSLRGHHDQPPPAP
jgi:hypothetical protein